MKTHGPRERQFVWFYLVIGLSYDNSTSRADFDMQAPGKPQEKLSPLAVAVVIDERNTLRQQLREAVRICFAASRSPKVQYTASASPLIALF